MIWLDRKRGFKKLNSFGKSVEEFLFIISYDKNKIFVEDLKKLPPDIKYQVNKWKNFQPPLDPLKKEIRLKASTLEFRKYKEDLLKVKNAIKKGETYLLNLTYSTPIDLNLSLEEIFLYANSVYKLLIKDQFVCFSPESFIKIENSKIFTFPMKGTIKASIPNAKEKILANPKEMAEHTMIVDLMRNDLNIIAKDTKVEEFRFIQKVGTNEKELLQVSSKISATLPENWRQNLGEILDAITPAGSISGTPKKKTLEIISEIENYKRGFYTGIFGICKNETLDSAVMIRFIENRGDDFFYKSGGGITIDSQASLEYQEMIDKIYIPI
jgi:para-aminobenzoate synthetase component 1